jgi:hypothetical protein
VRHRILALPEYSFPIRWLLLVQTLLQNARPGYVDAFVRAACHDRAEEVTF